MALSQSAILELVEQFFKDSAPVELRNRMQKAVPGIVRKMEEKGITLETTAPKVVIRDALFRLWRVVIPSGTLADMIRDSQDDRVVQIVVDELAVDGTKDMTNVVNYTLSALLDVTF